MKKPAARVFYISLVFSNDRRVLSQCNTRLRLFYLLIIWCLIHRTSTLFQISLQIYNFLTLTEGKQGFFLSYFIAIVYVLCN